MPTSGGTTGTPVSTISNLDYLIPYLRLKIGDTNSLAYRYTDLWLSTALVAAVDFLGKWWNFKYLLDATNNVYRNPNWTNFIFDVADGIVEPGDEQVIVVTAAYILLEGSLENSAWDYVSWRDAEISFSNLESSRNRTENLRRLWNELISMLKPPVKRLARTLKGSLPGYINGNEYEVG
jgi:hypothetical protein